MGFTESQESTSPMIKRPRGQDSRGVVALVPSSRTSPGPVLPDHYSPPLTNFNWSEVICLGAEGLL
jgi:hypothetical protein